MIIVPNEPGSARPTPSLVLLREVQEYLEERCPPTADLWVAGPEWVEVTVTATVVATSAEEAGLVGDRARTVLESFLHPLTGGPDGQGWAFEQPASQLRSFRAAGSGRRRGPCPVPGHVVRAGDRGRGIGTGPAKDHAATAVRTERRARKGKRSAELAGSQPYSLRSARHHRDAGMTFDQARQATMRTADADTAP